ncbi:MAG: winged helix-turn-helix domain-containing protein [Planctomycetota bacterium]|nr:winged helix-turn-helix domain-containing protein [Planctomycetota bacterium]
MTASKKSIPPSVVRENAKDIAAPGGAWTFLSNHTHVLLCLYRAPDSTTREVAALVGITERMVQKIVAELVESGFMDVFKVGRKNTYKIHVKKTLRHPLESHRRIGDLLEHLKK